MFKFLGHSQFLEICATSKENLSFNDIGFVLFRFASAFKVAPYNFSKKLNGTLVYNIFRQIYHLDESKQLIMINQRLEFFETTKNNFQIDVAMTTMTFQYGCQFAIRSEEYITH